MKKVLSIRPPCEITGVPHSIVKNKYKASEWNNITIYYSLPSLKKLLLPRYYKHWFLYVYSMYIFLKDNITPEEYDSASKALQLFVDDIETLYGSDFMKFNVHLLKHNKDFVRQFGALWAWSTFIFESYNGIFKNLFHGTHFIGEEISKIYYRLRYVRNRSDIFNKKTSSERAKRAYSILMNQCKVKNCIQ